MQLRRLLSAPYRVNGDTVSGHGQSVSLPLTCDEKARQEWEREHWGLPKNESQKRLWTLFFTDREPETPWVPWNWSRPMPWVEMLVRYGPPPASPAVTHTEQPSDA